MCKLMDYLKEPIRRVCFICAFIAGKYQITEMDTDSEQST